MTIEREIERENAEENSALLENLSDEWGWYDEDEDDIGTPAGYYWEPMNRHGPYTFDELLELAKGLEDEYHEDENGTIRRK